jgi:hypothetical protein
MLCVALLCRFCCAGHALEHNGSMHTPGTASRQRALENTVQIKHGAVAP